MANEARLLVRRGAEPWRSPQVGIYSNERGLQDMLIETPGLLPGVGVAAVVDEFWIPNVGSVDLVAVEPIGAITVVECKLKTNADIRRTVVGQVLAYAAGLWRMSYEDFASLFGARSVVPLVEAVGSVASEAGIAWDAERFRSDLSERLSEGAFRLCIAVDGITDELKSVVELLNTHTGPGFEVVLLELGYVTDGDLSILIPHAYGLESAELKERARVEKHQWTVDEVFAALDELCSEPGVAAVRRLFDYLQSLGATLYRGKGSYPTLGVYLSVNGKSRSIFAIYADPSGLGAARLSLSFGAFGKSLEPVALEALMDALERRPELANAVHAGRAAQFNTYPNLPIDAVMAAPGVVDAILNAFEAHLRPAVR